VKAGRFGLSPIAVHPVVLAAVIKDLDGTERRIHLTCREDHEPTEACHLRCFHGLRRAFAPGSADKQTPDALPALLRDKRYQKTQVSISMARQMDAAVASLHVPDIRKPKAV
jgi:hypothetical protein